MTTIGIVGATGQVGVELCLFLKTFPGVRGIALARTELSGAFLRRAGVECRVGNPGAEDRARALLTGCDLVCDLSLPRGLVHEIRGSSAQTSAAVARGAPPRSKLVFASTLMAFGHPVAAGAPVRHHRVARTAYGANKRAAETHATREGARAGHDVWVLRLGQVHGEMQTISRMILGYLTAEPTEAPDEPSNTVFVFSIAEALVRIAEGREAAGSYTLVSHPQWTWRDVALYYAGRLGIAPRLESTGRGILGGSQARAGALARLRAGGFAAVAAQRDFLNAYVLHRRASLEWAAKASWLRRSARSQIARGAAREIRDLPRFAGAFLGDAPGRRLESLSDSRATMEAHAIQVREILQHIVS